MAKINKDIQQLVLKRLDTIPEDAQLVTSSGDTVTKFELINHVKSLDDVGRDYIEMELFYIKSKIAGNQ
jgi:hypothetical protein